MYNLPKQAPERFFVFPNLFRDELNLVFNTEDIIAEEGEFIQIKAVHISGTYEKLLAKRYIDNQKIYQETLNTGMLPSGLYLFVIEYNNGKDRLVTKAVKY